MAIVWVSHRLGDDHRDETLISQEKKPHDTLRRQSPDSGHARDQKQNERTDCELQKADRLTRKRQPSKKVTQGVVLSR
jgi:hypothetical protein